jgi:hypothetical protein
VTLCQKNTKQWSLQKMAARVHRPLEVTAFKANGIIPFIGLTASREEKAFPITL